MKTGHGLYPNEWVGSVFTIDFEKYYADGYRGIIFDIDNTLVPHGKMGDEKLVSFIDGLKDIGFKIILVSNNSKERNVRFAKPLDIPFIYRAGKPSVKGYLDASVELNIDIDKFLCIGDQLFTDILGGNRAGMHTILVNPIDSAEEIQIIIKRKLELPFIFFYKQKLKKLGVKYPDHRLPLGKPQVVNNLGQKGHNQLNDSTEGKHSNINREYVKKAQKAKKAGKRKKKAANRNNRFNRFRKRVKK